MNVPIAVYLLLPPLALEAGCSGTPALRLFDWAVAAHPEAAKIVVMVNMTWFERMGQPRMLAWNLVDDRKHKRTLGKLSSRTLESNYL